MIPLHSRTARAMLVRAVLHPRVAKEGSRMKHDPSKCPTCGGEVQNPDTRERACLTCECARCGRHPQPGHVICTSCEDADRPERPTQRRGGHPSGVDEATRAALAVEHRAYWESSFECEHGTTIGPWRDFTDCPRCAEEAVEEVIREDRRRDEEEARRRKEELREIARRRGLPFPGDPK